MIGIFKSLFGNSSGNQETAEDKLRKKNFEILKYDGIKAIRIGKTGYAIRCFQEALAIEEEFETLSYLAGVYAQENRTEEAVEAYSRLHEMDPVHNEILLKRAQLHFTLRQIPQVIEDCDTIIAANDKMHEAYLLIAKAKQIAGQKEEAITDLDRGISLKNDWMEAYLQRARIKFEVERYEEAREDVEKTISLSPEEESAFMLKASIHEATGQKESAIEDYQAVIEINPFYEQAYLEVNRLLAGQGKPEEALQLLDEALEIKPDFARGFTARGHLRRQLGDTTGAEADFAEAEKWNGGTEEPDKQPVNFNDMYANRPL